MKIGKAVKAMRAGQRVTRRLWSRDHGRVLTVGIDERGALEWFDYHDGSYYASKPEARVCHSLRGDDVLADDWEVAPAAAQREVSR